MTPRTVILGVCTFRRPSLRRTLLSLAAQELPPAISTRLLVADNDETPSARLLVEDAAREAGRPIGYLHCPARNISIARNGILDAARNEGADLLAFVDDDEWVAPDWLRHLLEALDSSGAQAVFGPVRASYGEGVPGWMRAGAFHDTLSELDAAGRVRNGYSCNVLLSPRHPVFATRRFEPALGRSGGEDTEFFASAGAAGAHMAPAPLAVAFEEVPPERARLGWLARRRFRMGQTHAHLVGGGRAPARRAGQTLLAAAKLAASMAFIIPALPRAERRNRAFLRACLHAGAVSSLAGMRQITIYGGQDGPARARPTQPSSDRSAQ